MNIKKASDKDINEIAKLMLIEFSKPPFNERVSLTAVLKSLKFYFKIGTIYIAVNKNKILGVTVFKIEQYWEGSVIIIEDLAVKEEFKKQNIGKKLIQKIEDYARKNKIHSIKFSTNKKSKALNFYKSLGYKIKKHRVFMEKVIQ